MLATNRIAITNNTVLAQLHNVLVGSTQLEADPERAAKAFGLRGAARDALGKELQVLEPGRFFVRGPAISTDRVLVHVGDVLSRHPEPGDVEHPLEPPPPSIKIRHLLPQLAEIAADTPDEPVTHDGPGEVSRLRRQLAAARNELSHPVSSGCRSSPPRFSPASPSWPARPRHWAASARKIAESAAIERFHQSTADAEGAAGPADVVQVVAPRSGGRGRGRVSPKEQPAAEKSVPLAAAAPRPSRNGAGRGALVAASGKS